MGGEGKGYVCAAQNCVVETEMRRGFFFPFFFSSVSLASSRRGKTTDSWLEGMPQSKDISDEDLEKILDRRDLIGEAPPNAPSGPGWEEVEDRSGMSLLGNVNKE